MVYPSKDDAVTVGNFYLIQEDGYTYGYYDKEGKICMLQSEDANVIYDLCDTEWNDYWYTCRWRKSDRGIEWYNYREQAIKLGAGRICNAAIL